MEHVQTVSCKSGKWRQAKLKHRKIALKFIISGILLLALLLVTLVKKNEFLAEYIFSRGLGRAWIAFAGSVTSLLPFSLYEVLYFVLTAVLIWGIVLIIKAQSEKNRLKLTNFLASLVLVASFMLSIYAITAAPNYYRKPVPLKYADADLDADIIHEGAEYFLADFNELGRKLERNELGNVICPYNRAELAKIMVKEMTRLDDAYYSSFTPYYKNIGLSEVLDVMGLGGIFFSPTGEANISTARKACFIPCTIAHELAHSKGVMREDEANLVAYYITLTSKDDFIRYSGYMHLFFGSILNSVRVSQPEEDAMGEYYVRLDPLIRAEYFRPDEISKLEETLGDFAKKIEKLSTSINDFYLKLSGMEQGVDSYRQGGAEQLAPIEQGEIVIPQYHLTPTQRLIYQIYLDNDKE